MPCSSGSSGTLIRYWSSQAQEELATTVPTTKAHTGGGMTLNSRLGMAARRRGPPGKPGPGRGPDGSSCRSWMGTSRISQNSWRLELLAQEQRDLLDDDHQADGRQHAFDGRGRKDGAERATLSLARTTCTTPARQMATSTSG